MQLRYGVFGCVAQAAVDTSEEGDTNRLRETGGGREHVARMEV